MAAGLALALRVCCDPGGGGALGALGSPEPVSTSQPALVTWLSWDQAVQVTDPAGNHPTTVLGLVCLAEVLLSPSHALGTCFPTCRTLWVPGRHWGWFRCLMTQTGGLDSALCSQPHHWDHC